MDSTAPSRPWLIQMTPDEALHAIVQEFAIAGDYIDDNTYKLGGPLNAIPYLVDGDADHLAADVSFNIPFGPMYDAMKAIAETHKIGM